MVTTFPGIDLGDLDNYVKSLCMVEGIVFFKVLAKPQKKPRNFKN